MAQGDLVRALCAAARRFSERTGRDFVGLDDCLLDPICMTVLPALP